MKLNRIVIGMLSEKARVDVGTKSGAEFLRNDIEARTGEPLSINTVKRLVGVLPYDSYPREVTLDIIAKYLGYKNWHLLLNHIQNKISDFNADSGFIDLRELPVETEILLKWEPDRVLRIKHRGEGIYIVTDSGNGKLRKDDLITVSQVAVGFPFMVKEVVRDGSPLGNYTAALTEGISSVDIING